MVKVFVYRCMIFLKNMVYKIVKSFGLKTTPVIVKRNLRQEREKFKKHVIVSINV